MSNSQQPTRSCATPWWTPCAALLLALAMSCSPASTGGADLAQRFREHRATFDSLAALATADTMLVGGCREGAVPGIYVRDTPTANRRLSEEEVQASGRTEYARLLAQAGVPCVARLPGSGRIEFTVRTRGGMREGLLYTQDSPAPLAASFDDAGAGARAPAYVSLAPGWFLFRELKD